MSLFLFFPLSIVQLMYTLLSNLIYAYIHIFNWKYITDFQNATVIKLNNFFLIVIAFRSAYFERLISNCLKFANKWEIFGSLFLPKLFGSHVTDSMNAKINQQMKRLKKKDPNKSKWFPFFNLLFFFFFNQNRCIVSRFLHHAAG